jgi:hypothetical protein
MVFASFRSDFTLYKAKFLENAVVTSENSWCDVTQSEGGAVTGPNWTTAPRLAKKSMTSHESLISHCARICYKKKKKKKKKFRIWKKKKHNVYAHGEFTIFNSPTFSTQHSGLSKTQGWKLCQLMFLDPWCMISQEIAGLNRDFLLRKHLHACIISEVTAAWPWSRKPRREVQHCLERKKQRWTWKGLLQFDENCTVHTTNHRCKHSKLKTRVANHHRSFYSSSDITHYKIQKLSRHKIEEEVHRALAWLPKWYFLEFL